MDRRITLEEVQAAYTRFDVEPHRCNCACCALSVVIRAAGICPYNPITTTWTYEAKIWLLENLGRDYWNGFVSGFDFSHLVLSKKDDRFTHGQEDGVLIAKTLFGELTAC